MNWKYLNLEIDFEDRRIRDYTCTNFEKRGRVQKIYQRECLNES